MVVSFLWMVHVPAQVPSYVPVNGLIGWWPFNGNANDESGNGNHGTPTGGPALAVDRFGEAGKAYSMDGFNDYISVLRIYQSAFSASVWFNPSSQVYNPLIDAFDANWEVRLYNWHPAYVSYQNETVYEELVSPQSCPPNGTTWYHLAWTFEDNTVRFYKNGVVINVYPAYALPPGDGNYYFGASLTGTDQYFYGKLDDIGIWDRALTEEEVQGLFNATGTGIDAPEHGSCGVELFPNPAGQSAVLDMGKTEVDAIILWDANGRKVREERPTTSGLHTIELSGLAAGNYTVECRQQGMRIAALPLVVQR